MGLTPSLVMETESAVAPMVRLWLREPVPFKTHELPDQYFTYVKLVCGNVDLFTTMNAICGTPATSANLERPWKATIRLHMEVLVSGSTPALYWSARYQFEPKNATSFLLYVALALQVPRSLVFSPPTIPTYPPVHVDVPSQHFANNRPT